ncbi:M24 family metallopeptidase [Alterisphingorhabdus coralli]|uniref:Xaa-Pro peptidase family protein n=1 Tax=Alterisphingorhabdus coralli TaxID=3071408 RepID=A0AA97F613_9SPHN|nr:Xaa-Pro peptidase family protein [Parasphingorhabdus sp. SCSIO 66989]WOE74106.1 Xaa-Pro peptidase family protein [Parasphingorhabdus sp. SCSIO 66989]
MTLVANMQRRHFLQLGGVAALGTLLPVTRILAQDSFAGLSNMATDAKPISREERLQRLAKAQRLMREQGMSALLIEPGSSLDYFTGVQWWRSERLTAAVLGADGALAIVTPFFEEPSIQESLSVEAEILTWDEHENPLRKVADWLARTGNTSGNIGIEKTVRFFAVDGLKRVMPDAKIVSASPVILGCRMFKSASELALMQTASDITLAAYAYTLPRIERGMTPSDISAIMNGATRALGGQPKFAIALVGEAAAYPHGSDQPQEVKEGEIVLMDCGCSVHGYRSDISRTIVYGEPTAKQRQVWQHMRNGQDVVFEAAQIGVAAGSVDDAVRAYYETLGYGPDYKLPGTSHRTGHGIGMDGHESINLVRGETTELAAGMCFSNEPGIYLPGEFGVRIEDCFYMTEDGPRYFTQPSKAIDEPFG